MCLIFSFIIKDIDPVIKGQNNANSKSENYRKVRDIKKNNNVRNQHNKEIARKRGSEIKEI